MWKAYKSSHEYSLRAKYCDPDNFDMYIYNDFNGYGLVELIENTVRQILDADTENWLMASRFSISKRHSRKRVMTP